MSRRNRKGTSSKQYETVGYDNKQKEAKDLIGMIQAYDVPRPKGGRTSGTTRRLENMPRVKC